MSRYAAEAKTNMQKVVEHLKTEISKMRVGRATTSMVEGVKVEVYGNAMTMKEVAALGIPDAKTITITPWDKGVINDIEKGILAANLGLTPVNDGKLIRINLPQMTEERRKDFVKQIKKVGEDAKVAVRNHRRDALDTAKRNKDAEGLTEDDLRRVQDDMQKVTDSFVAEIDKVVEAKSKEVMTL